MTEQDVRNWAITQGIDPNTAVSLWRAKQAQQVQKQQAQQPGIASSAGQAVGAGVIGNQLFGGGEAAASELAATPAANAAWNAAGTGGESLSETSSTFASPGVGTGLSALMAAKGGYDTYNSLQNGGQGIRGASTQLGAGVGGVVGSVVPVIGTGIGAAAGAGFGNIMGYGLQGTGIKNHLALAATMPPLEAARLLGFDPVHKTIGQRQQENTANLLSKYTDNKGYQDFVGGMRQQFHPGGAPDPDHPYGDTKGNKYSTWDEYKAAGLDPLNLTGVKGNLELGTAFTDLTPEQKATFTKQIIDADLYQANKGEVDITDLEKAQSMLDEYVKAGAKVDESLTQKPENLDKGLSNILGGRPASINVNITGPKAMPRSPLDKVGPALGALDFVRSGNLNGALSSILASARG